MVIGRLVLYSLRVQVRLGLNSWFGPVTSWRGGRREGTWCGLPCHSVFIEEAFSVSLGRRPSLAKGYAGGRGVLRRGFAAGVGMVGGDGDEGKGGRQAEGRG